MDGNTQTFQEYNVQVPPARYEAYHYLEIPLTYQEHATWFNIALPHNIHISNVGPLGNVGATWLALATYTTYPHFAALNAGELTTQMEQLLTVYRRLRQHMYRVLNTAQHQAPVAAMPAGIPHITTQTINAIMGKTPTKRE